jgi:thiol:disulfide interchange protein
MKIKIFYTLLILLAFILFVTRSDNRDGFTNQDKTVIICKADWCGHCNKAKPEFDKMRQGITLDNGSTVKVITYDADQHKAELKALNVKGYPSIFVDTGSTKVEYPGQRTFEGVREFLNRM